MGGDSNLCQLCLTHPIINYCCTNKNCTNYQFNKYANQTDEPPKKRQRLNGSNNMNQTSGDVGLMQSMMSDTNANINDSGVNSLNNHNMNLGRYSMDNVNTLSTMRNMNNMNNMNSVSNMNGNYDMFATGNMGEGYGYGSLNEMTTYCDKVFDILQVDRNDNSRFACTVCEASGMRETKAVTHAGMHLHHQNKGFGLITSRRGNYRCFKCSRVIHMSWLKSHIQQCSLTSNQMHRYSQQDNNRGVLTFGTAIGAQVHVKTIRNQ